MDAFVNSTTVAATIVVGGAVLTALFSTGKKNLKNQKLVLACRLWEYLLSDPYRDDSLEEAKALIKKYKIAEPEDLANLFNEKEKSELFFEALNLLVYSRNRPKFAKIVDSITPLLSSEEKEDANNVSLNLLSQMDNAVEPKAPASPKHSSSNVAPSTPVPPSSSLVPPPSMFPQTVSPVVASPEVHNMQARIAELESKLLENSSPRNLPQSSSSPLLAPPLSELETLHATVQQLQARQDQMDAEMSRLLAMVKGMKKTASQSVLVSHYLETLSYLSNNKRSLFLQTAGIQLYQCG